MRNAILSAIFDQMADIMEILGEDPFRINSYRKVSRAVAELPTDVGILLEDGRLAKTPGIGKSSLAKIQEFVASNRITAHEELLERIPPSLLELLHIAGMGPKGVKAVYEGLHVKGLDDLKRVVEDGSLATLPGFGQKKAAAIQRGIEFLEKSTGRIRLDQAMEAAEMVCACLRGLPGVKRVEAAGSLRRRAETIGDVDILVATGKGKPKSRTSPEQIIQSFTQASFVERVLASGDTKGSAIIQTETTPVQVDVRVVPAESFGAALQYFTGSKQHNVRLREIAIKSKLKLNEYGLFDGDEQVAGATEEGIYKKLGLDPVPPLLREDRGEVEAARSHALPELVQIEDIRGDFHMHTLASDGRNEIEQMVGAARGLGYEFLCITDHSESSVIANGQSPKRLAKQIEQIRRIGAKLKGITLLAGAEVDILADGSLDFDDKLLADLDYVVASIHSGMTSPREKVTMRTLKAMESPYVSCIGHPTGRLLGQREAMDLDIAAVIEQAAQTHTAMEINANPYRLDLKDLHCKMATEAGVKLAIGTDAHSTEGLGLMHFGVATAGRGWATKDDILNTLSPAKLKSWLRAKRPR
ncbi:MAG: DNA polymerase/3'-5' exonuclease PolX [Sedimentisphaerales bacterium]|jgi:DNA polymerase (family 10)|nr:DNA polymerase/3'-5' exonuclease PolX [Sedimentisphaerales bacterium]HNY77986.1 DNA polymerase/3'-5' exonuclease PolX [Sedimentisphaerales bacterium]HOC63382.1 DNA polymerase/3'-5' exonuclease PolX [Sedimentisphaerales bacterium]HOH64088.1 DNA polymerase/3'-5' exonuclease PolX [Sedimentisphaerales bacterium]HQA90372.1 DNA polymerase/3'-5' exonuclease PolX [Sedimentisphaerales bacterium]